MCRSDGNQLLGLHRQRAVAEDAFTEARKGLVNAGRELLPRRRELGRVMRKNIFRHGERSFSPDVGVIASCHALCF
jgi:hypothetical protein